MKTKLLTLFLSLVASVGTMFAYDAQIGDLYYNLNNADLTAEVTYKSRVYVDGNYYYNPDGGYNISKADIPSSVNYAGQTYNVTSIGDYAFYDCRNLTSLTIPNGVVSIGDRAFRRCIKLTSVVWNAEHYEDCTSTKTPFYYYLYDNYSGNFNLLSQITSFTFGEGVEHIPAYLCCGMSNLTAMSISNSVTSIGDRAFSGCSSLTSVTIGTSVTSIGDNAFSNCSNITKVNISDIAAWCNISFSSYYANPLHYAKHLFFNDVEIIDLIIPNSVTNIGNSAFYDCNSLTSVNIPNSVTSIGDCAFSGCSSLTSVTIGHSVTSIGKSAFLDCNSLTTVNIPNSVTSIGDDAFSNCSNITKVNISDIAAWCNISFSNYYANPLYYARHMYQNDVEIKDLVIPNSVTNIGDYAFINCNSLTSVAIPNSVTSIGKYAFYYCYSLTSLEIPNSVINIGEKAFSYVPNIMYSGTATGSQWGTRSINGYVDGWLVYSDESKTQLIACSAAAIGEINIHNSVTSIGNVAFAYCSDITAVTIPNNVTRIGKWAFYGCSSLTSLTIPNGVASIEDYAFYGCNNLKSVVWNAKNCADFSSTNTPFYYYNSSSSSYNFDLRSQITSFSFGEEIEHIPAYLCSGFSNLTSITIPDSVKSMGTGALQGCSNLTSVVWKAKRCSNFSKTNMPFYYLGSQITSFTIGDEVEHIPSYLCSGLSNLTSVTIPDSVTSIGNGVFKGCSNLTSVIWNAKNCQNFSSANTPFYYYSSSSSDYNFNIRGQIKSFTFGEKVEHIPACLCSGMNNLTSVNIPNSVTSIGERAFESCSKLTSVSIPNSVTSIGLAALKGCNNLTSVIWNVKNCADFTSSNTPFRYSESSSSDYNFDIRNQITSFSFGEEVEHIPAYLCSGMSKLASLTIPNSITSIGNYAFNGCSSMTKVNISDIAAWCNIIFTSQYSNPLNYAKHLFLNDEEITELVIPNNVTSIGQYAFYNCSGLTSLTIPNSVTSIGQYAFYNCSGLTSLTIPNSVTSIGQYAFCNSSSLILATIGNNVTSIGGGAFSGCKNLTSIDIPNSVTSIGNYAFSGCSSMISATIGNSVTEIGDNAFYGCSSLTSATIGNSVTSIGDNAFNGCKNLTSVGIPNSVTSIGEYSFSSCIGLTSVNMGNSVTTIGGGAFSGCKNLISIDIPNSVTSVGYYAFSGCSGLTSVTIGNSVTSIGDCAFSGCSSLTSVIWNAKNCRDFYSDSTPFYCNNSYSSSDNFNIRSQITSFTFGEEVEHIPAYLCYNMTSLPSINIPHSVTSVGENAFYGCKYPIYIECGDLERMKQLLSDYANYVQYKSLPTYNLTKRATNGTITTTKTQFTVCEEPIVTCNAIANRGYQFVKWADGNTENPRTIELTQDTIMEALFEIATTGKCGRDNALVWKYDINTKALTITGEGELDANYTYGTFIESVNIGNGVTSIGYSAFYNCSSLTDVIIPNSVTSIGNQAFQYCANLITATIGNGVSVIGNSAFYNCSNLETVSLGAAVETIGQSAFYNCTRIIDIYCYANRVPEAYNNAFYGVSRKAYLWVPSARVRNYKTHEIWGEFDVHAIEADGVNTSTVKIVPTDNTAKIIWPEVEDAETYEITIYDQNGNIVCTLVFDSAGLLQSIAFAAPNRDNGHEATQASGFRFEVTGLTAGTEYTYTIVAKDVAETIIDTQEGSFTTTGGTHTAMDNASVDFKPAKVIRNGQLFILREGKTYTVQGQEVR